MKWEEVLYQCDCGFHKWRICKAKTSEAYCPKCKQYTTFKKCIPIETKIYIR